jgi:hypothetical protein
MLAGLDRKEPDEGDLHAGQSAQSIPSCVCDVEPSAIPAHADENESVKRKQAGDEGISTPRGNHVTVK